MARLANGENLCQFCPSCHRLVMRNGGCNHMLCVCGQDFCIICGGNWPNTQGVPTFPLCHPFYGAEDQHVLRIPQEVEARLAEEESRLATAVAFPHSFLFCGQNERFADVCDFPKKKKKFADENATGVLCPHSADLLYMLRLRRELDDEERTRTRCDVCGRIFRAFLLQCIGCGTSMCLDCRDKLRAEQS
ncbi:hypothetical protein VTH82DRAFT_3073 [Thermothelomyces myriococcoides]